MKVRRLLEYIRCAKGSSLGLTRGTASTPSGVVIHAIAASNATRTSSAPQRYAVGAGAANAPGPPASVGVDAAGAGDGVTIGVGAGVVIAGGAATGAAAGRAPGAALVRRMLIGGDAPTLATGLFASLMKSRRPPARICATSVSRAFAGTTFAGAGGEFLLRQHERRRTGARDIAQLDAHGCARRQRDVLGEVELARRGHLGADVLRRGR
jgi:hypothetical protein